METTTARIARTRTQVMERRTELERWLLQPGSFQKIVDRLPPSPYVTLLRLWGVAHGVYFDVDTLLSEASRPQDGPESPPAGGE